MEKSKAVDNDLIMSVYGLAASEMWLHNYEAAQTHMKMVSIMIRQIGGHQNINLYVMESIILGSK